MSEAQRVYEAQGLHKRMLEALRSMTYFQELQCSVSGDFFTELACSKYEVMNIKM